MATTSTEPYHHLIYGYLCPRQKVLLKAFLELACQWLELFILLLAIQLKCRIRNMEIPLNLLVSRQEHAVFGDFVAVRCCEMVMAEN